MIFLEKKLYHFSTHGGSGLGNTLSAIRELEPSATIIDSFSIAGSSVRSDNGKAQVLKWVDSLNLKKEGVQMLNVFVSGKENFNAIQLEVLSSYINICQAMVDKDAATLRKYMDPSTTMTHMGGKVQTLDEWIADIENGELNYFNVTLSNIKIEITGDNAVPSSDSVLDAAVYGGSRNNWNMYPRMSFSLVNGTWIRK